MTGRQNQRETDKHRVFLYKLLHNAPAPMTFDEIVKEMMMAPGNFSRACVDYQAHVGVTGGTLDEHGQDEAKRWWVLDLLTIHNGSTVIANKLFITNIPGRRGHGIALTSPERKWSANPDHPPKVWEERITRELVNWTPEIGAIGAKASAGMRYLAELGSYRAKHARIPNELVELLEAGEQAIRNNPRAGQ
jgi:hypothetical protein